jgi:hypothetical protein
MLVDKQLSESYLSVNASELLAEPINRSVSAEIKGSDEYKRYEITEN